MCPLKIEYLQTSRGPGNILHKFSLPPEFLPIALAKQAQAELAPLPLTRFPQIRRSRCEADKGEGGFVHHFPKYFRVPEKVRVRFFITPAFRT